MCADPCVKTGLQCCWLLVAEDLVYAAEALRSAFHVLGQDVVFGSLDQDGVEQITLGMRGPGMRLSNDLEFRVRIERSIVGKTRSFVIVDRSAHYFFGKPIKSSRENIGEKAHERCEVFLALLDDQTPVRDARWYHRVAPRGFAKNKVEPENADG